MRERERERKEPTPSRAKAFALMKPAKAMENAKLEKIIWISLALHAVNSRQHATSVGIKKVWQNVNSKLSSMQDGARQILPQLHATSTHPFLQPTNVS